MSDPLAVALRQAALTREEYHIDAVRVRRAWAETSERRAREQARPLRRLGRFWYWYRLPVALVVATLGVYVACLIWIWS